MATKLISVLNVVLNLLEKMNIIGIGKLVIFLKKCMMMKQLNPMID